MCAFGPTLQGRLISLEEPRRDELDLYRSWFTNQRVTRYLLRPFVPSEKREEEWYETMGSSDDGVAWRIVAGGQTVGVTGIHHVDWLHRQGVTGMLIGEVDAWGKGYASECVQLRTAFAFEVLGLERLESESLVENVAMHRALEKSGYWKIGCKHHRAYVGGSWQDAFMFELLREEWLARR